MREGIAALVRREDYAQPSHWIRSVDLSFDLEPHKTLVINRMQLEPNAAQPGAALRLDGEDITLSRVLVNGESVSFRVEDQQLVLENLPQEPFQLEIRNTCHPVKNTQLSGLYTSSGGFFTQCEAQGFRRITYFLDRPDVMSVYQVTLRADKKPTQCCCPTATWYSKATWKMVATLPSGKTHIPSLATCLPW